MLTKGAIGNLVNRYRAVLKKCNLINTFGSLAVASMLVLGGVGVAGAATVEGNRYAFITESTDSAVLVEDGKHDSAARIYGIAAQAGDTITINGDVDITLNAKDAQTARGIRANGTSNPAIINITGKTNLTVRGDKVNTNTSDPAGQYSSYGIDSWDSSQVTLNGPATIRVSSNEGRAWGSFASFNSTSRGGLITFKENATFIMDGNSNEEKCAVYTYKGRQVFEKGLTVSINDASTQYNDSGYSVGIEVRDYGRENGENNIDINSGKTDITIKSENNNASGVIMEQDGKININGDALNINVISSKKNAYGLYLEKNSSFITSANTKTSIVASGSKSHALYITESSSVTFNGDTSLNGDVYVDNSSTLTLNAATTLKGKATVGILEGSISELTIDSNDTSLNVTTDNTTSTIKITGSGDVNDAVSGNKDALMAKVKGLDNAVFGGMEEGLIAGAVDAKGVQKVNTVLADTLEQATAAPLAVNRILMNDVRKRMGDLRSDKNESGVWMRWDGGKLKGDGGLTNEFNTIQIGGDTKVAKNCRLGVAGSFTYGDIEHSNGGGEMESYTFAAYGTWMGENGMFADVIARAGITNSEISAKGGKADIDNEALSLSAEYGWRLPVCNQFFVEPQVELTYTHVTSADFTIKSAKYDVDAVDSVIGRAGLVAGWNLPDDRGNVYARASVVHEFLGDTKISASNNGGFAAYELNGDDTWLEYGIGANVKLNDKAYIWADVERTEGAEIEEEWRGTIGFRYSF